MDDGGEHMEGSNELPEEAWGDVPEGVAQIPGVIQVQETPNMATLEDNAREYLSEHPEIMERARKLGHDIIAHRTEIMFGAGLAASIIGSIVLFRYSRKRKR